MKFTILLICLSVVFATETSFVEKYQGIFMNRRSIMSVMTQVEAHMKNKGPMDAITKLLDAYVEENQQEQADHEKLHTAQMAECAGEFEFREGEIEDGTAAKFEADETLEKCQSQKTRAESDLVLAEEQNIQCKFQISSLIVERRNTEYDNETFVTGSAMVLEAIKGCYPFLDELERGGSSLIELTKHITKMAPATAQIKHMKHFTPLLSALAQVAISSKAENKINTDALAQVRSIIEDYQVALEAAIVQGAIEFNAYIEEATAKRAALDKEEARLEQLIIDLNEEISQLKSCVSTQTSISISAEGKISRNESLLAKAQRMCDAQTLQFNEQTESRRDELALIEAIKAKVAERFAQVSGETTARGEMTAEEIENSHVNESAYEQRDFVASK